MPRTCTICSHPERIEIDKALAAAEETLRTIADRWPVSKTALMRHKAEHLPQRLEAAKAINFGLLYGMGAQGLRSYALRSYGVEMGLEEATRYRRRFFHT